MVFLTGITGLVGGFIAKFLLVNGYSVKALVRSGADLSQFDNRILFVEGDVLDPLLLNKEIAGCTYVIHCAAVVSFSDKMLDEMMLVNIEGTKNVVDASLFNKVRRLIHISSIAAIGRDERNMTITESSQWVDSPQNTNYAKSKYLSELEVWRGVEEGLEAIVLNPSVVLGVGNWNKSSSKLFKYVYDEKPFYTNGNINLIDVRDIAEIAIKSLISEKVNERYILTNSEVISYQIFFEQLAKRFNKKAPSILVTPFMASIAWRIEWMKSLFTNKEPLVTRETAKQSRHKYVYVNDKAIEHFNHRFINLSDTFDWACKAYLSK